MMHQMSVPVPQQSSTLRKRFTTEEDKLLKSLVEQYGDKNWDKLATHLPGRSGRQCRDRYRTYLQNERSGRNWSTAEDELMIKIYSEIGPKWTQMSMSFVERSASHLKNRWNYLSKHNEINLCPPKPAPAPVEEPKPETPESDTEKIFNQQYSEDFDFAYQDYDDQDDYFSSLSSVFCS